MGKTMGYGTKLMIYLLAVYFFWSSLSVFFLMLWDSIIHQKNLAVSGEMVPRLMNLPILITHCGCFFHISSFIIFNLFYFLFYMLGSVFFPLLSDFFKSLSHSVRSHNLEIMKKNSYS